MGKRSDELQREIAEYRHHLDRRVDALTERIRTDARDTGETLDRDMRERLHVDKYVEERPFLTLAAALAGGIVLGAVTPGFGGGGNGRSRDTEDWRRGRTQSSSGGMFDRLIGSASGALGSSLEDEIRSVFRQVTGGREDGRPAEGVGSRADRGDEQGVPPRDRHAA